MAWMIVSDSSCEIRGLQHPAPGVQFALVPFKIRIGEREYVDLPTLNVPQMLQAMTDYNGASTSACPSPEEWAEYFLQADKVIALTISSNLSGSYNAALSAREMVLEEHPEKQIFILDTLSCAGALGDAAELANKLIGEGLGFEDVCFALKKFAATTHILFALASFDNLAKNGRVNRVVGFIAGRLNMRVLGRRTHEETLRVGDQRSKVRHRAYSQEDEGGQDGPLVQQIEVIQKPAGAILRILDMQHDIRVNVDQQHTEGDWHQKQWLKSMPDCQIKENTCHRDHDQVPPGEAEERGLMHEISQRC